MVISEDDTPKDELLDHITAETTKPRWVLIPDANGKMYLIDLISYKPEVDPFWNAEQDVFFVLYTQRNPTLGIRIGMNADFIRSTYFNSSLPTRIVIVSLNNY